ncbi:MAG: BMP family ABC transporter substrate-binding protein [Pseudomonadota bacterium]
MFKKNSSFAVLFLLLCSAAAAQDWQIYNEIPGRVQEIDTQSVRVQDSKVFFSYRERWLDVNVGRMGLPILAVVDCALQKRSDIETGDAYKWKDIYPGTGQANQAHRACRLAGLASSIAETVTPIPNSVIRLIDTQKPVRLDARKEPPQLLKAAFVYVGEIGDGGYTYAHDAGRRAVEAQLQGRVQVSWAVRVPEGEASAPMLQRLIDQGNTLIFATVFGYQETVLKLAEQNPRVRFEQISGYKPARNVRAFDIRSEEATYLAGVLAGRMTDTNVLGFVGSIPIPDVIRNLNAFTLGARSVNPRVRVRVSWVNEWFNPPKESEAARDLINGGADILMQNTDSSQVLATAQQMGRRAIGWNSDMSVYGPNAHLASVAMNWGPYYVKSARDMLDGTWFGGRSKWGIREDAVQLQSIATDVPVEVRKELSQLTAKIASGSLKIWRGPIISNNDRMMVEPGSVMDEKQQESMYFLVNGVNATLPTIK